MKISSDFDQEELKRRLSYDPNSGLFTWLIQPSQKVPIGSTAGTTNAAGYIKISVGGKLFSAHRLAWREASKPDLSAIKQELGEKDE